jgi:hypothetical protein
VFIWYILENTIPPAEVVGGKNMEREERKDENVKI